MTGAAGVEIHVKSGGVDQMELVLPEGTNLLNLSAPSLRSHRISDDDDRVVELSDHARFESFRLLGNGQSLRGAHRADAGQEFSAVHCFSLLPGSKSHGIAGPGF